MVLDVRDSDVGLLEPFEVPQRFLRKSPGLTKYPPTLPASCNLPYFECIDAVDICSSWQMHYEDFVM